VRELLPTVDQWRADGVGFGRAVVVRTFGSAPRQVGAVLLASDDGRIAGSVSGGCVEGAVVEEIEKARRTGQSAVVRYGISDEQAWSVGLACGATIEVLVEPELRPEVEAGARASDDRVVALALPDGSGEFAEVFPSPRRLVVYGAVEIARPLVRLAHELGYRVVVVDARAAFATAERFPEADELIVGWPDEVSERVCLAQSDAVAVLAHDPKLDDPALLQAFAAGCRYVGALGSRKTQDERRDRLSAAGVAPADVARLHGPIGLDLGGREPAETALAIMAEGGADRCGGSALLLRSRPSTAAAREAAGTR
jgi:xanthine dehydrogenase accessory factor